LKPDYTVISTDLFTLAIKVNKGVTGAWDVLGYYALIHAVNKQMEATTAVH